MLDWLWSSVNEVFDPFVNPSNRLSYVYLLSALFVAIAVFLYQQLQTGQVRVAGLVRWLLPREILLHPSAQADYAYYFINKFMTAAIYSSVVIGTYTMYGVFATALEANFGPPGAGVAPSVMGTVLVTVIVVLVTDATLWFAHYIFHRVPILWEFHKVHHSAEVMTPITAARMHPVEEIVDTFLAAVTTGGVLATADYLMGDGMRMATIFEINVITGAFYFAAFNLRHSHVWVRYPVWLQHIFICPAQHQIHHSTARRHWDKNMGFIFSFWDWGAGTLYAPKEREHITFGLGTEEDGTWRSVGVLYFRPFVKAWALLTRGRPAGRPEAALAPDGLDPSLVAERVKPE